MHVEATLRCICSPGAADSPTEVIGRGKAAAGRTASEAMFFIARPQLLPVFYLCAREHGFTEDECGEGWNQARDLRLIGIPCICSWSGASAPLRISGNI